MDVRQTSNERAYSSKMQETTDTRLQGRLLVLARVVWFILVALAALVFFFSLPVYIAQLSSVCSGIACGTGQLTPQIVETLRNHGFHDWRVCNNHCCTCLYPGFRLVHSWWGTLLAQVE